VSNKGQVTIPAALRKKHGLRAGDEVKIVDDGQAPQIVPAASSRTPGRSLVRRMRGRGSSGMTTEEIMGLLRGE
jgi:AbrB family looped-hinge helix DNA binding protein